MINLISKEYADKQYASKEVITLNLDVTTKTAQATLRITEMPYLLAGVRNFQVNVIFDNNPLGIYNNFNVQVYENDDVITLTIDGLVEMYQCYFSFKLSLSDSTTWTLLTSQCYNIREGDVLLFGKEIDFSSSNTVMVGFLPITEASSLHISNYFKNVRLQCVDKSNMSDFDFTFKCRGVIYLTSAPFKVVFDLIFDGQYTYLLYGTLIADSIQFLLIRN